MISDSDVYKELISEMIKSVRKHSKNILGFLKGEKLNKEQLRNELMILFIYLFDIRAMIEMGDTDHLLSKVLIKYYFEHREQHDDWGMKDKENFLALCNKRNIEYHESTVLTLSRRVSGTASDDMAKCFQTLAQLLIKNIHSKEYRNAFAIAAVVTHLVGYWDFAGNIIEAGLA
jgi:hypothetical protein